MKTSVENLNRKFFTSGFYEEFWGWEFTPKEAEEMVEGVVELLGIGSGHILDWCGGWGRISILLARKGFRVTLLDFYENYLEQARRMFKAEGLPLETVTADCRETPPGIQADYACCLYNTLGFFDDREQLRAFKSLYNALKPGGKVIMDCINLLFVARDFEYWIESKKEDGTRYLQSNTFDFRTYEMRSDFKIIDTNGVVTSQKPFTQRLYTPKDLIDLVEAAGFKVEGLYGNFEGEELDFNSLKIVLVAAKPLS